VPLALFLHARTHHSQSLRPPFPCAGPCKLPASVPAELRQIAERILPFPDGKVDTKTLHKVATVVTNELLILTWEAVRTVSQLRESPPSGKAQLKLLAWVVAGAVGGPMLTDLEQAHTLGKRLKAQADRVRLKLLVDSASFDEQRAAAGQDSAAHDSAAELAEIDAAEQMALDEMLTEVYTNAVELLPMEPVQHDAPVPEPVSERPSLDEYRRLTRQAIALEPARAGPLDPFDEGYYEASEMHKRMMIDEDARVDGRVALIKAKYEAGVERLIELHKQQLADKEQAHELQLQEQLEQRDQAEALKSCEEDNDMLRDMLLRAEGRESVLRDVIRECTTWQDQPRLRERVAVTDPDNPR
jgi:hypothetical protein